MNESKYTAAIITISDKGSAGLREDTSGPALSEYVKYLGIEVIHTSIIPDELEIIAQELIHCSDELKANLILTTGGTGFSKRDITPEATAQVVTRLAPGIPEAMRAESMRITPKGCLSRGIAGLREDSLIINLPGSKKAAIENIKAVEGAIIHGLETLLSSGSNDCGEIVKG